MNQAVSIFEKPRHIEVHNESQSQVEVRANVMSRRMPMQFVIVDAGIDTDKGGWLQKRPFLRRRLQEK